jgi:ubiquinone/menaquinone biosynthesis C-methylase UbiE
MNDSGWDGSAAKWIEFVDAGDANRIGHLDPVVLRLCGEVAGQDVLDVGCGEGRFCRMLAARGAKTYGIDPTQQLIELARRRDAAGHYLRARAERIPCDDGAFELVVSYLSLIDIADHTAAIAEVLVMAWRRPA